MNISRIHSSMLCLLCAMLPFLMSAKPRKGREAETLEELLPPAAQYLSPSTWQQGMPFVLLRPNVSLALSPEIPEAQADSTGRKGEVWHYDSMVSEEDWMGQQLLQLRFLSPQGKGYRFSTGRPMSVVSDPNYQPVIACLYPQRIIQEVDSILRARSLYILLSDERVHYQSDTVAGVQHEKFVPVVVDSVTCGNELAPLAVFFHRQGESDDASAQGYFLASLPGSRQTGTSTSLSRFLSLTNPYLLHPDIAPETWKLIRRGALQLDMSAEEVRLAWGRPNKVEKGNARTGVVELWYYSNNRVLQLWDGRLYKIGIL